MDEYGYFSKDVSLKLEINSSTLRQWCKSLEDEGYIIKRNNKEQRIFYERDINMLFELKALIDKTRNRDNAIKTVVARYKSPNNTTKTHSVNGNEHDNKPLLEYIQKQEKFNQELLKRLDEQNKFINERLDQRDKALTETMNQLMDQRKKEIKLLEQATEGKGNWLSKLFKKRTD